LIAYCPLLNHKGLVRNAGADSRCPIQPFRQYFRRRFDLSVTAGHRDPIADLFFHYVETLFMIWNLFPHQTACVKKIFNKISFKTPWHLRCLFDRGSVMAADNIWWV
jgi:hypothetical protein